MSAARKLDLDAPIAFKLGPAALLLVAPGRAEDAALEQVTVGATKKTAKAARYTRLAELRERTRDEAERRFAEAFHGASWIDARDAFTHDVEAVKSLLEAFAAARAARAEIEARWHPSWGDATAPAIARMLHKQLSDLWSHLEQDPGVKDVERSAILLTIDTPEWVRREPRGGTMVESRSRTMSERTRVVLATAVSILLSNGLRPDLTSENIRGGDGRVAGLTCAEAFDHERSAVVRAARRLRKSGASVVLQCALHWPAHLAAARVRRRD